MDIRIELAISAASGAKSCNCRRMTLRFDSRRPSRVLSGSSKRPRTFRFNSRGELFIHLRTPTKDVFPSHWDTAVGGVLAAGETFAEGVRREVREELSVEADVEELFPFRYADSNTVARVMVYKAVHDGPFRLQPEEIVCGEFVPLAEVKRRATRQPFCPDGLAVLAEYEARRRV